jgi:hypothetical protein
LIKQYQRLMKTTLHYENLGSEKMWNQELNK